MHDILIKVGADITNFSKNMAEANKSLTDFGDRNKETFDSFKKVGGAITGVGVGIAAGLGGAVKVAATFESGMSKVAAVSGATGDDLDALTAKAREMGSQTSFSATEAANGLEYMALAGWSTEQMLGGLEPVLHLAEAGAIDLGRASDLVTDSMSALGLEVDDLNGYLDKVAKTSASANTDVDALMEAFVIAGGTFERFNVPLEEANAFLATLANRGFKGSEAGTALNAIMTRLTASTGPSADALEELGISAFDSEGNFRGMEVVMKDVEKALSGLTDQERAHYQTQIAGLNHGKSFSAMLNGLANEYDDLKGEILDSNGALLEMRNVMKDNLQGALENLSSAFEEIAISIGTALLPYIKQAAAFLQRLADWFNGLNDSTKSTIAIVAALTAVFALIAGPLLLLIGFIPAIIKGFLAVKTVFLVLTGPIGLTIAAIGGLIAAFILAYKRVEWFRDFVDEAWAKIKEYFAIALDWIIDKVTVIMTDIANFFNEILGKITDFWNKNGEQITAYVKLYFGMVWEYIKAVMGWIKGIFEIVWPIVWGIVKVAWNYIKMYVKNGIDLVLGIINTVMALLRGDWEGAWESIKETVSNIWENIKGFFDADEFRKIGRDIIDGLIKGIGSMTSAVTTAVKNIGTKIKDTFTSFWKVKSPSRVMRDIAKHLPGGIIVGIDSMRNKVAQATERMSEAMMPDKTQISMSYATPDGVSSSLSNAINGTVDVGNSRDDRIADAIERLEGKLETLRIEVDKREFGRVVSDTATEQRNAAVRSRGGRRI